MYTFIPIPLFYPYIFPKMILTNLDNSQTSDSTMASVNDTNNKSNDDKSDNSKLSDKENIKNLMKYFMRLFHKKYYDDDGNEMFVWNQIGHTMGISSPLDKCHCPENVCSTCKGIGQVDNERCDDCAVVDPEDSDDDEYRLEHSDVPCIHSFKVAQGKWTIYKGWNDVYINTICVHESYDWKQPSLNRENFHTERSSISLFDIKKIPIMTQKGTTGDYFSVASNNEGIKLYTHNNDKKEAILIIII